MRTAALVLVAAMMAMNAGWNWAFFRAQDPFLRLLLLLPYDALVGVLLVIVARVDRVGLRAMLPYAAYLVYANYWSHGVWRLNS